MTATLHREQYSSFFAFSSSDSADEREASWEEAAGGGGGRAGDREELTGAGGGGEALGEDEEDEEEERPGAGRAEGGLEGGGSLPALLEEGKVERSGEEVGRRKGLRGEEASMRLDKSSGEGETEGDILRHRVITIKSTKLKRTIMLGVEELKVATAPPTGEGL